MPSNKNKDMGFMAVVSYINSYSLWRKDLILDQSNFPIWKYDLVVYMTNCNNINRNSSYDIIDMGGILIFA